MMFETLVREVWFEYSHSRGAGGQHVNKASTRVVVCFSVDNSGVFEPVQKAILKRKLCNRISKDGVLRIAVEDSRSQSFNKKVAVDRLGLMLKEALKQHKRRRKTVATYGSKIRRLESKKRRSEVKAGRRKDNFIN